MSAAEPIDFPEEFNPPERRSVGDRLGRLEGMLIAIQGLINNAQLQWASANTRIDHLEQRLLKLEQMHVTKEDLKELAIKVDSLIASTAKQQGGLGVASWSVTNIASWLAVLIALAAMLGIGKQPEYIQQDNYQQPPQPSMPRRTP